MVQELSGTQLQAMVITERVNSCLSLAGIFFVIVTFTFSSAFNKPINRLIYFASWGNIGSNVASLISEAGPLSSTGHNVSPLCQFQAFLVQMFLGVDCYWAFCMAVNVYLAFFRGYTTEKLRALDIAYLFFCYGLSFIPALVFLFISNSSRQHVYGPAIIWCWISVRWDFMRIVFLYGIVWLAMLFAIIVYAAAAQVIWSNRRHLDGFLNPVNENPFTNIITTDIDITYEQRPQLKHIGSQEGIISHENSRVDPYSVNVEVGPRPSSGTIRPLPAAMRMRSLSRAAAESKPNTEAWLYARVAVLFFIALLITWLPSSANRLYGLVNPDKINFPLNYISSFVFPLQGFWNAIVYILTSKTACRQLWNQLFSSRGRNTRRKRTNLTSESEDRIWGRRPENKNWRALQTEPA